MAVIAMCFQLMQDEMVAKFKWIGQKLGIGKKKEDNENKDEEKGSQKSLKDEPVKK